MTKITSNSVVYFDTNIIVYYIDANSILTPRAIKIVNDAVSAGARLVISDLTVAECIYKWHKERNFARLAPYTELFQSGMFSILPIAGDLIIRAAEQGGELGLKLLDAVHYVTALEAGCDVMVTADARFRSSRYLEVVGI